VLAIAALRDGKGLLTSGLDGSVHLWRAPYEKPENSSSSGNWQVRLMAADQEGSRNFAAVTSDGHVLLVDNEKLTTSDLFKADRLTTLLWPKGGVVAGDAQGKLWRSTVPGKLVSKSNARINALASKGDELYVATAASEVIVLDVKNLDETRRYTLTEGSVDSIVAGDKGVYVIIKGALRPLLQNGLGPEQIAVDGNWLTYTGDGALLVVVASGAVAYVDPISLKVIGSVALPSGVTVSTLGPAPGTYGAAAGTTRGRLLLFTNQ
jgi:WD40 repeat protein